VELEDRHDKRRVGGDVEVVRPMYTAPRDLVSGIKIQRRNLWMASAGGCGSRTCRAQGCRGTENQEHMVTCRVIKYGYWKKVRRNWRRSSG
jgi:hypothetical protein